MSQIELIKKLRSQTGLGFSDIKKALDEANGDETKTIEILKSWGHKAAAKKGEREIKAGLIDAYIHGQGRIGVLVEVGCESDFVARNADFKDFVHELSLQIASMNPESVEELLGQEYFREPKTTIQDLLTARIAKIGENIKISRFQRYEIG